VRATFAKRSVPSGELLGTQYPSYLATLDRKSFFLTANHTKVFANNLLQEVRAGYFRHFSARLPAPGVAETPTYTFPGLTIGTRSNYPQWFVERVFTARYDLNWTKGRHDMKVGGEWLGVLDEACWPSRQRGQFEFSAIPADIERRFPLDAWNDPGRWDFSGLESLLLRYRIAYAEPGGGYRNCGNFGVHLPRPTYAAWFGDTWRLTDRLTVNLGLRYDLPWGDLRTPYVPETDLIIDNGLFTENVGYRPNRLDANNIAPRFGFSYNATGDGRLVLRGGTGLFYTDHTGIFQLFQQLNNGLRAIQSEYRNDGRPGFLQDPSRGVTPEQVLSGQVALPPQAINVMSANLEMPYTWQSTVGFQKQLTDVMAFDADLIYWRTYKEDSVRDPNLFYNPATGYNLHPTAVGRPAPQFGSIELYESKGKSNYLALSTSLTRRFQNNFQAYVTHTVMFLKNDLGQGLYGNYGAYPNNPFDRQAEWGRSADFQRHTVRANGIWSLPMGFSVAGTFWFGSGNYFQPTSPVNPYGAAGTVRVLADGTVLERNSFKGEALHKLDLRLSKTVTVAGVTFEGTAEVFNVYNHSNYGSYNMVYGTATFGQPVQNLATAYLPRLWQLGVRLSF